MLVCMGWAYFRLFLVGFVAVLVRELLYVSRCKDILVFVMRSHLFATVEGSYFMLIEG